MTETVIIQGVNCTAELRCGDVLDVLRTMPSESVHCVITSPPYW